MSTTRVFRAIVALALLPSVVGCVDRAPGPEVAAGATIDDSVIAATTRTLIAEHGESAAERIERGVRQVADRWWDQDGDGQAFSDFCAEHFTVDREALTGARDRLAHVLEQSDGRLHEINRMVLEPQHLDVGPVGTVDLMLGELDLATHVDEGLYASRAAFWFLLNFPVHSLEQRLREGDAWTREQWAESRLMDRFAVRTPTDVLQRVSSSQREAAQYIAEYNIRMDRLLAEDGEPRFDEGLRLISHWGLRDELKSQYAEGADGLERQRMIQRVMERIVRQEIPAEVIDNAELWWTPSTNEVQRRTADGGVGESLEGAREPDTRYLRLLEIARAQQAADPYAPTAPTYIRRRFELDRQLPEKEVVALLTSVLTSEEFRRTGELIRSRLGRPLEAFDIWYDGFKARGSVSESRLDGMTRARYPDVPAFQRALPNILTGLGFAPERADFLTSHIVVDPSRGAGHAWGAVRREDSAHLRTRFGPEGMDYKGYNIAVHELGHNVEQVFSLNSIDWWPLNGVPNTAFTEALAFTFQNRDLELLGQPADEEARRLQALDTVWNTAEIGGVALVDIGIWNWMYEHPDATPAEVREATLAIARDVWNTHFAPVFDVRDQEILAVYSHMISSSLYLPDYPIGHVIAFQLDQALHAGDFGADYERMCRQGRLTPDAWMRGAVGSPISAEALLAAARESLDP